MRPGSAAKPGDGTARRSLAGRELGAGPGRRGQGGRARKRLRQLRAGIAAVRRVGECGGTRGREGKERVSEQGREKGARRSARPGAGAVASPRPVFVRAAAPLRPLAVRAVAYVPRNSTPRLRTPPCPGSPLSQRSPSAPRRRLRPHVTLAPLFLRCRLAGTCLSLGARPFVCSASLAASPRSSFSLVAAPIPPLGDTPLLSSAYFFFRSTPGVLPSALEASLSAPLTGLPIPCMFRVDSREVAVAVVGCKVDGPLAKITRSCQLNRPHASFVVCSTSWKAHIELQASIKIYLFLNGSKVSCSVAVSPFTFPGDL